MSCRCSTDRLLLAALACAVALAPARGDEPKPKLVQKVYAVADLVVPIKDYDAPSIAPVKPTPPAATPCPESAGGFTGFGIDFEIMCRQDEPAPACCPKEGAKWCEQSAAPCCQAAAKSGDKAPACCPNGPCCPDGPCCPKAAAKCCEQAAAPCCQAAGKCCEKSASCPKAADTPTKHDTLIKLITSTVSPQCWAEVGGSCTIAYMPIGMGLVVSAPEDVQQQVADLLAALRRLQAFQVAFEVRFVAVTDTALMNRFFNDDSAKFAAGEPLFLCRQRTEAFLEAVQGDRHARVLAAPKLTTFNGQRATILCTNDQFFVTGVAPVPVNGQTVYLPKNEAFSLGFQVTVRPTVSADRGYVRCELSAESRELATPNVPVFPVTTMVTPVFEGGAQGQPVPFTQFIQQPQVFRRGVEKALTIPDGGTAVLYAGKCEKPDAEAEDGPCAPLFDWINDLVDLFSPPAEPPTVEEHLFVLVTPRVLVTEPEPAAARPMPVGPPCAVDRCYAGAPRPCPVPCQLPMPVAIAPCCPAPVQQCGVIACPMPMPAPPVPMHAPPAPPSVQLDVSILCVDPAAWDQPVGAAWADLSPKACENKSKVIAAEEATRFCNSMRNQGAGKLLCEPRLMTLSGRPATFLSGGQQAVPEVAADGGDILRVRYEPFGTQITFLPVVQADGNIYLECECAMRAAPAGKQYRVTVESPGEEPRTTTFCRPADPRTAKRCVCLPHAGRTFLMHCGRDADGRDVMVMVSPHLVGEMDRPAYLPMPTPVQVAAVPPPLPPTVWTAPVPAPVVQAAAQEPAAEPKLAKVLARYRQACAAGDVAKARRLAERCLAIDPTCFGK